MNTVIKKMCVAFAVMMCVVVFTGCNDGNEGSLNNINQDMSNINQGTTNYTHTQYPWRFENNIGYYFDNPYMVHIKYMGNVYVITRAIHSGSNAAMEWQWENDGDIDIRTYDGRFADIDSPYDYDDYSNERFTGYMPIVGSAFVLVYINGKLHKKPTSFLKSHPSYNKKYKSKYVTKIKKKQRKSKSIVKKTTVSKSAVKLAKTPPKKKGKVATSFTKASKKTKKLTGNIKKKVKKTVKSVKKQAKKIAKKK